MDVNFPQAYQYSANGYTCPFCASYFQFLDELNNHISAMHNIVPYAQNYKMHHEQHTLQPILPKQGKLSCSFCGKSFHDAGFLKLHLKSSHGMEVETKQVKNDNDGRRSPNNLQRPKSVNSPEPSEQIKSLIKCDGCEKTFSKRYRMKEHAVVHSEPSIPCQFCGYMFKEKRSMVRHTSKDSTCHKCQQLFNCPGLLKKHKCNVGTQGQNQSENAAISDTAIAGDAKTLLQPQITIAEEMLLENSDNVNDGDDSIEVLELEKGNMDEVPAKENTSEVSVEEEKSEKRSYSDSNLFAHNQMLRYFQEVDDILASMNSIINA